MWACLGIQSGPGKLPESPTTDAFAAGHAAVRIGLHQPPRARQVGGVEPRVAGHARHEEDQVGGELAAFGDHAVRIEALELVAEVSANAAPVHLGQQVPHRLGA